MSTITFDFRHYYRKGERRESDQIAYQWDLGHVAEIYVPVNATYEIHYCFADFMETDDYAVESTTAAEDGGYKLTAHIPNKYFERSGELKVYVIGSDDNHVLTTYEGYISIRGRIKPDDYTDDDPENEATRILAEAREARDAAIEAAEQAEAAASQSAAQASIAKVYDATKTYSIGDYCLYDGQLYECTTEISTPEAWTAAHWTAATVGTELNDIKGDVTGLKEDLSNTFTLDYTKATRILVNSDLNDVTTIGNYYIATVSDAGNISNVPTQNGIAYGGRLTVLKSYASGATVQIYFNSAGRAYYRAISAGSWTAWGQFVFDRDIGKPISLKVDSLSTRLSTATDFDTLTDVGSYIVGTKALAEECDNCPVFPFNQKYGGRLIVSEITEPDVIEQEYITSQPGYSAKRQKNLAGWGKWYIDSDYSDTFMLEAAYADSIAQGSDLDDFTTPGNYKVTDVATASTIDNMPESVSGRLMVITLTQSASVHQLYITSSNNWYIRELIANAWSPWKKFADQSDIDLGLVLRAADCTYIQSNSDLDDYKTPGNYRIANIATASTIVNVPEAVSGRLAVFTLVGTDSVHQLYITSSNNWYTRELIASVWSPWKRLVSYSEMESYIEKSSVSTIASKGAYNALQGVIKNSQYDIAFANAFVPLQMKNYIGNTQNVHPKVLYFADGFGGHDYWMAYTPYPRSQDKYENPCIAYSDDGYTWTNIDGNPLDDPNGNGYNSDTHLVYNEVTEKLECWYRYVGASTQSPREETIYRQTSSDGLTWSTKEIVYSNTSGDYAKLLSPAVIIENDKYCIWVVNSGTVIDYYEAPLSDVTDWTKVNTFSFSITDDGISVKPWHIDVIKDGSTYAILIMCRNGVGLTNNICSLFITTSADNDTYGTPTKVVAGSDSWDKYMYRSSIVKVGNKYRIYYSANDSGTTSLYANAVWGMGITESDTLTSGYIGKYE